MSETVTYAKRTEFTFQNIFVETQVNQNSGKAHWPPNLKLHIQNSIKINHKNNYFNTLNPKIFSRSTIIIENVFEHFLETEKWVSTYLSQQIDIMMKIFMKKYV